MPIVLTQHPYFGEVTVDQDFVSAEGPVFDGERLPLKIVLGRTAAEWRASADAVTQRIQLAPKEITYQRLQPMLDSFQTFCEALSNKDRSAQAYFGQSWPKSAGEFELIGVTCVEEGEDWQGKRDFSFLKDGPFGLHYKAHDADAWEYAGNVNWPPEFHVVFDEFGEFASVEEEVDARYKALPDFPKPIRWEDGYSHSYFGECDMGELETLKMIVVAGREVEIDLYMMRKAQGDFEPERLDQFVPLLENLDWLDALVRANIPEQERLYWLGELDERAEKLAQLFPGAKKAEDVSPEAFAKALWLDRICLSLSPEGSGGAAMTLDYLIFPVEDDGAIFAAKFSADGKLMGIVTES